MSNIRPQKNTTALTNGNNFRKVGRRNVISNGQTNTFPPLETINNKAGCKKRTHWPDIFTGMEAFKNTSLLQINF